MIYLNLFKILLFYILLKYMSNNHNNTNINTNSNLFNDMNNTDLLFINILNTMYNDNLRIIHHLMDQNSEITFQLIDILNNRRRQNIPLNHNRQYHDNRSHRHNRHRNNYSSGTENTNTTQRRVYIDNIPYYIDDLQLFTLPNINTTTNTNTNTNTNINRNLGNNLSRIFNSFLEPVNIIPTQSQIENATRNIIYGDILDPINNSCPISLEPFTDISNVTMIRHCRHIFNTNNLMSWFNSNCKCPVCRYDIRNYDPNNNDNNNDNNNNNNDNNDNNDHDNDDNNDNNHDDNEAILEYEQGGIHGTSSNSNNINTRQTQETRETRNRNDNTSIEALFFEIISDISNNNIEYTYNNTSTLFNSLFPPTRRRESRR